MQDFLSDSAVSVTFRYGDDKQPSIPDATTAKYSVYDHSGQVISALQDIPITTGPSTFQSTISIAAIYNEIDTLRSFERRTVLISWKTGGTSYSKTIRYRLLPMALHTVTPEAVRAFIGINPNELPDGDIDLYGAYLLTTADVDQVVLDEALTSGTINEMYANDAITMQAVLAVIPSLQARVAQSEKNGIMGYDRLKIVDFSALFAAAMARYQTALGIILDEDATLGDFTLIVVTQDADPFTG